MNDLGSTTYAPGDLVPWHVQPGVAFASYAVSFVGAATTVELLHRRPEGTGARLWYVFLRLSCRLADRLGHA